MHSTPTPAEVARIEEMGPHFTKVHLPGSQVLHRFTEPDAGAPHDHPWGFTSHVLSGGYIEDVYTLRPDGIATVERKERRPGTSHQVEAGTVHRIVGLLAGECWTLVEPGPLEQQSGFYHFDGAGIWHRYWHEAEFRLRTAKIS